MIDKMQLVRTLGLGLLLTACGSSQNKDEALDVEVTEDGTGIRGTTTIDGEELVIESRIVADDSAPPDLEYVVASVSGAEDAPYAEWRIGMVTDHVTGSYSGWSFGQDDQALRRDDRDWGQLAGSRVGTLLTEVSARATAVMATGKPAEMDLQLFAVSDMGPYLQSLPVIMGGLEALCGDGACSVDENDENCPEDCGCAAEQACGGVAPFGCYCSEDCAENGDCCVDACQTCGAGCPPCGENVPCDGSCTNVQNACDGKADCPDGEDEARCNAGVCRPGQLACDSGSCIEFYQFCDGTSDCPGGEDEICECAFCDPG